MSCYLTRTTAETHAIIRDNLAETPVYGGWVDAKGPRYCPSIEDKIVRFADKESHQACGVPCHLTAAAELVPPPASSHLYSADPPMAPVDSKRLSRYQPKRSKLLYSCCRLRAERGWWVQVFLEPEGRDTPELYVQGFSTGLPERLQLALLRTLPGWLPSAVLSFQFSFMQSDVQWPDPSSLEWSRSCFVQAHLEEAELHQRLH